MSTTNSNSESGEAEESSIERVLVQYFEDNIVGRAWYTAADIAAAIEYQDYSPAEIGHALAQLARDEDANWDVSKWSDNRPTRWQVERSVEVNGGGD